MVNKGQKIKEILSEKTVGIAGAGGLGSNAAVALARCGIGKLVIVDFDKVEESNLNRQYYFADQVGRIKVEALKENINKIYPEVDVEIFTDKLISGSMTNHFSDVDLIVEALDSAEIKTSFIEEVMTKMPEVPLVAASGVAGYGHSDRIKTKKVGNLYMVYDKDAKSSDEGVLMAPRVCLFANWQANVALEILLGVDK